MLRAATLLSFRVMCTWLLPPHQPHPYDIHTRGQAGFVGNPLRFLSRHPNIAVVSGLLGVRGTNPNWLKTSISMRGNSLRVWHNFHDEFSFARPVKLAKKDSLPSSQR